MSVIKSYHDLDVWKQSRRLVKVVYELTQNFPKQEMYTLAAQMRRCAISIPSNIAEGYSRHGTKDYIHFVSIAFGSAAELETQLLLAMDLGYVTVDWLDSTMNILRPVQKMLFNLRQSLQAKL